MLKSISVRTYCYIMSATWLISGAFGEWNNMHPMALHPSNLPVFDVIVGVALLLVAKIIPSTPPLKK